MVSSSQGDGNYSMNTTNDGKQATVKVIPLKKELPAAEVSIDRTRDDDGSVTIIITRKT